MSLEQYQDIVQLVDNVERADVEFGQDLWLMAERILLQRLTRTFDKSSQLNSILQVIKKIRSESEIPYANQIEDAQTADLPHHPQSDPNLASGFALAVEMLEGMDTEGLYKLISLLRNTSPDISGFHVVAVPSQNDERHDDTALHTIYCLSHSGFRSMQKTLYDKYGTDASSKLYEIGESYGMRIASTFKNKGLTLEKTIRQIESTAQIAGWGEIHLHRVSEDEVDCVIKNSMFSFEKNELNRSCFFAAGVLGGIMSGLLSKQQHFIVTEVECIVGGDDSCKFEIKKEHLND